MRLIRVSIGIGAFILTASTAGLFAQAPGAAAQAGGRGQTPPPPQNLQVLPKDMPREELLATMRGYTAGLGVMCNYCHIQEGRGGRNDFATDEKAPKKTARVMITMMNTINKDFFGGRPRVTCFTCHRGATKPLTAPPNDPECRSRSGPVTSICASITPRMATHIDGTSAAHMPVSVTTTTSQASRPASAAQ
jgi:hypothetical protein